MEGDKEIYDTRVALKISIHSLRMEGDFTFPADVPGDEDFNPLPPHGGRRLTAGFRCFQGGNFNPLPPHGGRPAELERLRYICEISIHSLRMEGDYKGGYSTIEAKMIFQSTPSAWRETDLVKSNALNSFISIHSLRMEGDPKFWRTTKLSLTFQSTPSAWRETCFLSGVPSWDNISIHSLRMEGDNARFLRCPLPVHFNPLPPHGGRLRTRTGTRNAI